MTQPIERLNDRVYLGLIKIQNCVELIARGTKVGHRRSSVLG